MSYNPNFYNKFHGNNATFQNNFRPHFIPPPPAPPPFFISPAPSTEKLDQEFVKAFEYKIQETQTKSVPIKSLSISEIREELRKIIISLNDLKEKEQTLTNNVSTISEEEWSSHIEEIEIKKALINETLAHVNGPYLDVLRKLLAKRAAKRLRLKRVRSEIKREKEDRRKELEERSRKIDENLQAIKNEIIKAKQEQEAKFEADVVLKEVLRKKHDAKKCIVKLDALVKLRRARQSTAKGRGEAVSETETIVFYSSIEKLKSLWIRKLSSYEAEEAQLRAKLNEETGQQDTCSNVTEREVARNLDKWKNVMFGGQLPQADFKGDVGRFIAVRSDWDQYINNEGTPLPVGWVPPTK